MSDSFQGQNGWKTVLEVQSPTGFSRPDGSPQTIERTVTMVHDWENTAFGPINFGYAIIGPARWVGDVK